MIGKIFICKSLSSHTRSPTKRAPRLRFAARGELPDAGNGKRQCALAGRCSLEARSPDLRTS